MYKKVFFSPCSVSVQIRGSLMCFVTSRATADAISDLRAFRRSITA